MPINLIKQFLRLEALSGVILLIASFLAILWANSPLAYLYNLTFRHHTLLFLINEGLMAFFFLIVGLEIKRSFHEGKFASYTQIILPLVAALGGMLIPVIIYILFNYHDSSALKGWAIPVATDIAFALGVLSLFGRRVPFALKLFLLVLAIFDDIGAIIIIAIGYSQNISYLAIFAGVLLMGVLIAINRLQVKRLSIYLLLGLLLWYVLLNAGIHPTISGFLLALTIPYSDNQEQSPLYHLEQTLHPFVAYLIMPLFALANAGFSFEDISYGFTTSGVVMGTAFGLFLGKQMGVFASSWLLIRSKYAELPQDTSWFALYGVALLCGIGFTMSLFLGTLSFHNESLQLAEVRLGVIMGSILSGACGALILMAAFASRKAKENNVE